MFPRGILVEGASLFKTPQIRQSSPANSGMTEAAADLTASGSPLTIEIPVPGVELAAIDGRPAIIRFYPKI
jgi:hypothetical protein